MDSFLAWYATMGELDFLHPCVTSRCVKFDAASDPTYHFSLCIGSILVSMRIQIQALNVSILKMLRFYISSLSDRKFIYFLRKKM
jgi:hypothetical protein